MAKFENIFNEKITKVEAVKKQRITPIHYEKLSSSRHQYRQITDEAIENLADLIEADGEVLQPLLVRKSGADNYEILAGHKRMLACKFLAEEREKDEFKMIPCIVADFNDVKAEFSVYSTNGYSPKNAYETMREIEGMARLLKEYPEEFDLGKGRIVEKLSSMLNMSRTTVTENLVIANNLSDIGMEAFQKGEIDKSSAYELSALKKEDQKEVIDSGQTTYSDIKKIKKEKVRTRSESIGDFTEGFLNENEETCNRILDLCKTSSENKSDEARDIICDDGKNFTGDLPDGTEYIFSQDDDKITFQKPEGSKINIKYDDFISSVKSIYGTDDWVIDAEKVYDMIAVEAKGLCPHCGNEVYYKFHDSYCGHCGMNLTWEGI